MKLMPACAARLLLKALAPASRRAADFVIGGAGRAYMRRWWLTPRNRFFNVYLHETLRDDDDRALHDHPWVNVSLILDGGYVEVLPDGGGRLIRKWRGPGSVTLRRPSARHRLELPGREALCDAQPAPDTPASWSLFITGPRVREWGFYCPRGWIHHADFTNPADGGATVGRGCDAPASRPGTAERMT